MNLIGYLSKPLLNKVYEVLCKHFHKSSIPLRRLIIREMVRRSNERTS